MCGLATVSITLSISQTMQVLLQCKCYYNATVRNNEHSYHIDEHQIMTSKYKILPIQKSITGWLFVSNTDKLAKKCVLTSLGFCISENINHPIQLYGLFECFVSIFIDCTYKNSPVLLDPNKPFHHQLLHPSQQSNL